MGEKVVLNQDYFRTFEDQEDHLLLDMDSLVQRKDDEMLMSRIYSDNSSSKKCTLGELLLLLLLYVYYSCVCV